MQRAWLSLSANCKSSVEARSVMTHIQSSNGIRNNNNNNNNNKNRNNTKDKSNKDITGTLKATTYENMERLNQMRSNRNSLSVWLDNREVEMGQEQRRRSPCATMYDPCCQMR